MLINKILQKTVLMSGDSLCVKYIADSFLVDVKIVNTVHNMLSYTGYYNNKIVTIGTCRTKKTDSKILDVVLATSSYSLSNYPKLFGNDNINEVDANKELNYRILLFAKEDNVKLTMGKNITSDVFALYLDDFDKYIDNYPKEEFVAMEVEAFCIFF